MIKVSHSAYKKYLTCPAMYNLHYNEKLRPVGSTTALKFGSAMDEALNELLVGTKDPLEVFKDNFKFEDMDDVEFHKNDYDDNLFTAEQRYKLDGQSYEYKAWASLRVKGRMLLEAYINEVYPNVIKVHSVQRELEGRRGFIDAVMDYEGYGKVLFDHKTASQPFKPDAIAGDTQLALYAGDTGIKKVGFIVLNKKILYKKTCLKCGAQNSSTHKTCNVTKNKKRCHGEFNYEAKANIQVMIETLKPRQMEIVKESISQVEIGIKNEFYPMNLGNCRSYYGKNCPYLNYCLHKDKKGLQYKEDK